MVKGKEENQKRGESWKWWSKRRLWWWRDWWEVWVDCGCLLCCSCSYYWVILERVQEGHGRECWWVCFSLISEAGKGLGFFALKGAEPTQSMYHLLVALNIFHPVCVCECGGWIQRERERERIRAFGEIGKRKGLDSRWRESDRKKLGGVKIEGITWFCSLTL